MSDAKILDEKPVTDELQEASGQTIDSDAADPQARESDEQTKPAS